MSRQGYITDIEGLEDDDIEDDTINVWEEKQKELLASTVDYNLNTLSDLVKTKTIDVSPSYQRRFRWKEDRQSKLIESFLMNVPVPPIFLNEDDYGHYSVIDGKQRLMAIHDFITGKLKLNGLKIFSDINGMTINDLPERYQNIIRTRPTLRAIIILRQSNKEIKFEVFRRINTGGVNLNAQEIRNSAYPGPLNNLILELSDNEKFQSMLGIKNKEKSKLYQEMRDTELVLRYFTFRDGVSDIKNMKIGMDRYMLNNQKLSDRKIKELRTDFLNTIDIVSAAFGEHAFQPWIQKKNHWRKIVIAPLFDAEMLACRGMDKDVLLSKQSIIQRKMQELMQDSEFKKVTQSATNNPSSFAKRINMVKLLLESATRS